MPQKVAIYNKNFISVPDRITLICLLVLVATVQARGKEGDHCDYQTPCGTGLECYPRDNTCYAPPPARAEPHVWLGKTIHNPIAIIALERLV